MRELSSPQPNRRVELARSLPRDRALKLPGRFPVREFGVRVAPGASPTALGKSVLGEAAIVGLVGVACGLSLWMLAGRGLASLLVGLDSTDAGTQALVSGLILTATLLAAWLPARRAVRVDPVEALRAEN